MKFIKLFVLLFLFGTASFAQQVTTVYDESADAASDLKKALSEASATGKYVFIQAGGNWCPWCIRFHKFLDNDTALNNLAKANYVMLKINYSRSRPNHEVLAKLGYPQRFGFPVFIITDAAGHVLHIQDSGYLEDGQGYDRQKVSRMFTSWSPAAISEAAKKYKP